MLINKGVYLLIIKVCCSFREQVGALGNFLFTPGYYIYVGSALGPGGLLKRICRHLKKEKKLKWHIDYLTVNQNVKIVGIFLLRTNMRKECWLSDIVSKYGKPYIKKFGATDCKCYSHLYKIDKKALILLSSELRKLGFEEFNADSFSRLCD